MTKKYIDDLKVLKSVEQLADSIWEKIIEWNAFEKETLGKQLTRSADSIGANIAEAYGRFHFGEKKQFLYYARGSLYETKYWLNRLQKRHLVDQETISQFLEHTNQISKELNSFIAYIKKLQKASKPSIKEPNPFYQVTASEEAFNLCPPEDMNSRLNP